MLFFHVYLLRKFLDHNLPSELLYVARVKTSRRFHKLGEFEMPELVQAVETIVQDIGKRLKGRWSKEQRQQAISRIPDLSAFEFENDTAMSLTHSRNYLTQVMQTHEQSHTNKFSPKHFPRLRRSFDFHSLCPDALSKAVEVEPYTALADFESIVQDQLDIWVEHNRHNMAACQTLRSCLELYISSAKAHYSSFQESQSLMILTIMELWVALDTISVIQCPLLSSYSPEIPTSFLDPLLLRRAKSIERANRIELYLRKRHDETTISTSIYSDRLCATSFSVRYFETSASLQAAKIAIEQNAAATREAKCKELREMNAKYESLTQEGAVRTCDYNIYRHSWSCRRCSLRQEAGNLRIKVHEWPLPTQSLEAEAVVFELNCPSVFAIWRIATYQILRDIGMAHVKEQSKFGPQSLIGNYEGFHPGWKKANLMGRITFGSSTKSFLDSHYREHRLPAQEAHICVNNGLHLRFYDARRGEGMPSCFDLNLSSYCTLQLSADGESSYSYLQDAVARTTHQHNDTIANQEDCPVNLSIHEHLAFSNLRCGSQLQWMNIARELRTRVLTFSREEVHTLITQAAWQIGPLSQDDIREWHFELGLPDFGIILLREAKDLLDRVRANWMEATTVKTISMSL
jgi:hypothetical protein